MTKKRKRHTPEQIVKKLRDAEVMLNAGKSMEEVLTPGRTDTPRAFTVDCEMSY